METTGINKTVYRSDIISNLDSFTSVRNVLAWEMFQDGQVRNYDGVINDLQRLYPEVDFDSVTDNVDPESIAADKNAIYALVDNILNKLTEYGISKDNFNYAIWACDNPEDVADTYGVEPEDVSAYKITDGILLQDLGVEGQLYGVAYYPEEDWDVIESSLKGGDMKTREDYKDYYLEQLTEQFGDMTERDYNSAKKFCYDEEWNLGEVGNMAEAIDGLGDAWTEYQKQYKEGFEIMNNVIKSAIDYSSLETVDVYDKAEREMLQVIEDLLKPYGADIHLSRRINGGIPEISVTAYFKNGWSLYTTLHGSSFSSSWFTVFHNKQTVAEKQYTFAAEKWKKDDSFRERDIKSLSTKLEYAIEQMKNHEYDVYANKHLYPNGLPEGVKAPPVKAFNDFWDIGSNGVMEYIGSSLEPEWTVYEPHFKNLKPRHEDDPKNGWGMMADEKDSLIEENGGKVTVEYGHGGSCTLYGAETGDVISTFTTTKEMQDFKKNHNLTIVKNSRRNNIKMQSASTYQYINNGTSRNKTSLRVLFSDVESMERDKYWFESIIERLDSSNMKDLNITYLVLDYDNCEAIFSFKVLYHNITRYCKLEINDGWYYLDIYKDSDLQDLVEENKGTDNYHLVEDFKNAYWFFTDRPAPFNYY